MANNGQHEIFNFDTGDADFDFETETIGYVTSLTFRRKRKGKPDDTVSIWVRTEWLALLKEKLALEAARVLDNKLRGMSIEVALAIQETDGVVTAEINDMIERELRENFEKNQDNQSRVSRGNFHDRLNRD